MKAKQLLENLDELEGWFHGPVFGIGANPNYVYANSDFLTLSSPYSSSYLQLVPSLTTFVPSKTPTFYIIVFEDYFWNKTYSSKIEALEAIYNILNYFGISTDTNVIGYGPFKEE